MSNNVTFQIKIAGSNALKSVTVDAQELGKAFSAVKAEIKNLEGEVVTMASSFQLLEGASTTLSEMKRMLSEFVSEFQEDDLAESRLAQAMRNTMDASDEEIQSIKALAEAQEKLGVVSAGVQLSAAQELATYLEYSDSLKTILPVLNDMVAQQLGVGASAESATQIATMLGKVMNGQTEALSRYGYKFDEAQKHILQFGEESERAAVLAEVVEQSVAGMNEALAQTPSGAIAQAKNEIDGMKAAIGKAVSGFMPLLSALSDLALSALAIAKLTQAIKALHIGTAVAKVQTIALTAAQRLQAVAARILGVSQLEAAAATGVLKVQVIALEAAMTLGLSLAISAVVELLARLFSSSNSAADAIEEVDKAQEAYKRAASEARAETAADIVALEDLIKKKGQEGEMVETLNRKYGDVFGTYNTAAQWYDTLVSKSKEYCEQLGYEAAAAQYKEELAEALRKRDEAQEKRDNTRQYEGVWVVAGFESKQIGTKITEEWAAADKELTAAEAAVNGITEKMRSAAQKAKEIGESLKQSTAPSAAQTWETMNLADLDKRIAEQKSLVESLAGSDDAAAKAAAAELKRMEARARSLRSAYGLDSGSGSGNGKKDKWDGGTLMANAATYKELGNNIKYYQTALEEANPADRESIRLYKEKITALKNQQAALGVSSELESLEDINAAIAYQQLLRASARKEDIAGIDAAIERLEALKSAMENAGKPMDAGSVKTYAEIDAAIAANSALLKNAGEEERAQIQATIDALNRKKKAWEAADRQRPGALSTLETYEDLDNALSYWQERQKTAAAQERAEIQKTIDALTRKRETMESIAKLSTMADEIEDLGGSSPGALKIKLKDIGAEGFGQKIQSLKLMAADSAYAGQKKEIESLIGAYSAYQAVAKASELTLDEGWSSIKNVSGGIRSLTATLEENGSAWEMLSGIIDSVLTIFNGFSEIIEIIKTFTALTKTSAATTVSSNAAVAASEGAKATAQVQAAAAGALAAHSSIPFVGVALGLGLVASIIAAMASLPKFASGGIAYGPTLGLFGEYAGAASNPEVVAPLDRLKALIGQDGEAADVRFVIRGRDLVGLMTKTQRIRSRVE